MTQKEIDKFLANTKVYVDGKSKEIQEKLFSLGYYWYGGKITKVIYEEKPFLYIYDTHNIAYGCDMRNFIQDKHREISAEEILSLELTELAYKPFKSKEECWQEMLKHQPFGWVFSKNKEAITFVYYISINYIRVNDEYTLNGWTFDYEEMFDKYTFADGTPFGIKED